MYRCLLSEFLYSPWLDLSHLQRSRKVSGVHGPGFRASLFVRMPLDQRIGPRVTYEL
jgi:hypothetical protein